MHPFQNFSNPGEMLWQFGYAAALFVLWLGGIAGTIALIHFFLTLPMRRAERTQLFLDLIGVAIKRGQPLEETLISIAECRDATLGARFHLVVAWLQRGLSLHDALAKVPRFLPPQVRAMLRAGEKLGDLEKVMPAIRQLSPDAVSQVRGGINYVPILGLATPPAQIFIMMILMTFVFPKLTVFAEDMESALPAFTRLVFQALPFIVVFQLALVVLIIVLLCAYIGGARLSSRLNFRSFPIVDWVALKLPWRRKRLSRDFSSMLAILLDAGIAEAEAVRLAADCTANSIFQRRADRVIESLQQGENLPDAVAVMDKTGEFRWRLKNAHHARGGFLRALAGWHEAMDAKAYQQEQAAAHGLTTAFVLLNGLLVGSVVVAVFLLLTSIVDAGVLW